MSLPVRGTANHAQGALTSAALIALACASAWVSGCQKADDHPAFAMGCESNCKPSPTISIGSGNSGGTVTTPTSDAGFDAGTLTGNVIELNEDTFSRAVAFPQAAIISADGSSGTAVTATWDGMTPYQLGGVAVEATNWISVSPNAAQGDALQTFQAVQTNATDSADLAVVSGAVIDGVLTAISTTRAPALGQVVLFFRNAGTGAALSGVQATMSASEAPAYAETSGWVLQDDTTTTGASGLVVFGNVELAAAGGTQTVTVSRPATATTTAVSGGQFAVKVVEGAVTLATVDVQL